MVQHDPESCIDHTQHEHERAVAVMSPTILVRTPRRWADMQALALARTYSWAVVEAGRGLNDVVEDGITGCLT